MKDEKRKYEKPLVLSQQLINDNDTLVIEDLERIHDRNHYKGAERNSRCVSVDTILIAPDGRNKKKKRFKAKKEIVKFRCSRYEKKMLLIKAKHSGLTLSEFCRRISFEREIKERFTDEQIDIYRKLVKYHNNFKSIGNMFRRKDARLSKKVYELADEISFHLKKIRR